MTVRTVNETVNEMNGQEVYKLVEYLIELKGPCCVLNFWGSSDMVLGIQACLEKKGGWEPLFPAAGIPKS